MVKRRTGIDPLAYMGVEPSTPAQFVRDNRNPTTTDYENFNIGTVWIVKGTNAVWMLVDKAEFIATWRQFTVSIGELNTLTGNVGGVVPPTANNIDIQGDGPYIFTGTPVSSLLTLSDDGTIATEYVGDTGSAIPSNNILNVVGGSGVTVTGSGDTLTIDVQQGVLEIETDIGGPVSPILGVLQVLGGNNITTTGSGGNIVTADLTGTTNHAVQIGNASGSLTSLAIGTDGQVLIGATGANPAFATLTSNDNSITFTAGANSLNLQAAGAGPGITSIETDSGSAAPAAGVLNVFGAVNGSITTTGSGNTITAAVTGTTQYAPQMGNAFGSLDDVGIMTTGELMVGRTGTSPNLSRLIAGPNVTVDDLTSPGVITISATGGGGGIIITVFTSSGVWTKNPSTTWIKVQIISAGVGGGSGRRGANLQAFGGSGGPGIPGGIFEGPQGKFPSSATVTIGAGSLGGASVTTDNTDGNDGAGTSISSFYTFDAIPLYFSDPSTQLAWTIGGSGGTSTDTSTVPAGGLLTTYGGTMFPFSSPVASGAALPPANNNATQSPINTGPNTGPINLTGGFSGGSGAPAYTVTPLAGSTASDVPNSSAIIIAGGTGGIEGGTINGGNGNSSIGVDTMSLNTGGTGGGGGGGQSAGPVAGNGGDGGYPGGCGGGGGGSLNGTNSGAGGDGEDAIVFIYETLGAGGGGGGGVVWTVVTADQPMLSNIGYITNSGSLITLTLPTLSSIGDSIRITGKGAGGWSIAQNTGQTIFFGTVATTTGVVGSLSSNEPLDSVELVCITANTDWIALSSVGNFITT